MNRMGGVLVSINALNRGLDGCGGRGVVFMLNSKIGKFVWIGELRC